MCNIHVCTNTCLVYAYTISVCICMPLCLCTINGTKTGIDIIKDVGLKIGTVIWEIFN